MIVADTTFERVTIRHSGFTPEEVTEASFRFLANGRRVPRTRAVTGLDQNVRINKQLWELATTTASPR